MKGRVPFFIDFIFMTKALSAVRPYCKYRKRLHCLMEGAVDNIRLLLRSKLDKVYCIAADPDSKLRIIFRMLLSVQKSVSV